MRGVDEMKKQMNFLTARSLLLLLGIVAGIAILVLHTNQEGTVNSMGANGTVLSRDETRISYTKIGRGPAIILVDGAFCYRKNGPSTELAALLAQNFTVYAYDRRGRGESGDHSPYSIQAEVDDLAAIVDQTGAPVYVVGVSSGGALAMQAAASGVPIRKMALYEPPFISDNGIPRSFQSKKARVEELIAAGDRGGAVRFFLTDVFGAPRAFALAMPIIMPTAWKRCKSVVHTIPNDLTILDDRTILNGRSALVSAPALVLEGEKSPQDLRDASQFVAHVLPHGRALVLAGQDHNLRAKVVAPVLTEFFSNTAE
jgi:pimeloyl-ACP methyl ester carboxylesterase